MIGLIYPAGPFAVFGPLRAPYIIYMEETK